MEAEHREIHAFLRGLDRTGVARVGVREHVMIEQMLSIPRPPEEIPRAIAAVLGTSPEQVANILGAWDDWARHRGQDAVRSGARSPEPGELLPPGPSEPGSPGRRLFRWGVAMVLGLVVGVAVYLLLPRVEVEVEVEREDESLPSQAWMVYGPPAPPWPEPPPPRPELVPMDPARPVTVDALRAGALPGTAMERGVVLATSAGLTTLGAVLLALTLGARRRRRQLDRQSRADRAQLRQGSWALPMLHQVEPVEPFPPATLEAIARELSRASHALDGSEWDVPSTVDATARAAGQLQPRYMPRHQGVPLLCLVDTESGDHPFLHVYDALLENWARLGLSFERWEFRGSLHRLTGAYGVVRRFGALQRARSDALVLVFTRLQNPFERSTMRSWVRRMAAWPGRVVLLDPDPRPVAERTAPGALPEGHPPHLPLSEEGLWAAARWFREGGTPLVAWPERPQGGGSARVLAMDRWAALATVVPRPRWAHLDDLRRTFLRDDLPHWSNVIDLLEHLHMGADDQGPGLDTDRVGAQQLEALRGDEAGRALEHAVRTRLKHQLAVRARELAEQGHAYAARVAELKVAVHETVLGDRDPREVIGKYLGKGEWPELERLLEQETGLAVSAFSDVQKQEVDALMGHRATLSSGFAGLGCLPLALALSVGASAFGASAMWWSEWRVAADVVATAPASWKVVLPEEPEKVEPPKDDDASDDGDQGGDEGNQQGREAPPDDGAGQGEDEKENDETPDAPNPPPDDGGEDPPPTPPPSHWTVSQVLASAEIGGARCPRGTS